MPVKPVMPVRTAPDQRQDLHNASVDEGVALQGACAEIHLQTGRTCTLPYGHEGSCQFVTRDRVAQSLPARR
jgi:hypothetical protein